MSSKHKKYPVRIPRTAMGIRSQESRSGTGRNWWAKRWLERIEAMGLGSRLGRGKNYAVSGQVISLAIEGPCVSARVVGTRKDPYEVSIVFRTPAEDAKSRIVDALRSEPMTVARLLADDMPTEVERLFASNSCELFPGGKIGPHLYDMTTSCNCPDYANPCKHSTAVLTLLGEDIARRPLTLLELRGITAEDLCDED